MKKFFLVAALFLLALPACAADVKVETKESKDKTVVKDSTVITDSNKVVIINGSITINGNGNIIQIGNDNKVIIKNVAPAVKSKAKSKAVPVKLVNKRCDDSLRQHNSTVNQWMALMNRR